MPNEDGSFLLENAEILYRTNFGGDKDPYNDRGDKTFNVVLPEGLAEQLSADGWNVKLSKPRKDATQEEIDDFVSRPYLEIKVQWNEFHSPRVVMIGNLSRKRTELDNATVGVLDSLKPVMLDITVRPRQYDVNGKTGIKAYAKSIYFTFEEDELDLKYAEMD